VPVNTVSSPPVGVTDPAAVTKVVWFTVLYRAMVSLSPDYDVLVSIPYTVALTTAPVLAKPTRNSPGPITIPVLSNTPFATKLVSYSIHSTVLGVAVEAIASLKVTAVEPVFVNETLSVGGWIKPIRTVLVGDNERIEFSVNPRQKLWVEELAALELTDLDLSDQNPKVSIDDIVNRGVDKNNTLTTTKGELIIPAKIIGDSGQPIDVEPKSSIGKNKFKKVYITFSVS
jgi:hypothetical protein